MKNGISEILNAVFSAVLTFCLLLCPITSFEMEVNIPVLSFAIVIFTAVFAIISYGIKKKLKFVLSISAIALIYILVIALNFRLIVTKFVLAVNEISTVYSDYLDTPIFFESVNHINLDFTIIFVLLGVIASAFITISLVRWNNTLSVVFISILLLSPCFVLVNTLPTLAPLIIAISMIFSLYFTSIIRKNNPKICSVVMSIILAVMIVASSVICALNPVETYKRFDWQNDTLKYAEELLSFNGNGFGGFGRNVSAKFSETEDLSQVGNAKLTSTPVMTVKSEADGKIYLRGTAYADYNNNKWSVLHKDQVMKINSNAEPFTLTKPLNDLDYKGKISITTLKSDDIIYSPYYLSETPKNATLYGDVCIKNDEKLTSYDLDIYYSKFIYLSSNFSSTYEPNKLEHFYGDNIWGNFLRINENDANNSYRDFVYDNYLQIPEDTKAQLMRIINTSDLFEILRSQLTALQLLDSFADSDISNQYSDELEYNFENNNSNQSENDEALSDEEEVELLPDYYNSYNSNDDEFFYNYNDDAEFFDNNYIASAVINYVSNSAVYSLDTPKVPYGKDFPVWFLSESSSGFCVHFATASVLMMRTLGVPARYVTGYYADISKGTTTITSDNAHAWVEYFDDDIGWVPLEATPYSFTPYPTPKNGTENSINPTNSTAPSTQPTTSQTPNNQTTKNEKSNLTALYVLFSVLLIALFVTTVLLRKKYVLGKLKKDFGKARNKTKAILLYRYIEKVMKYSNNLLPEKIVFIAEKAKFSPHELTNEEIETMQNFALEERKELYKNNRFFKKLYLKYFRII